MNAMWQYMNERRKGCWTFGMLTIFFATRYTQYDIFMNKKKKQVKGVKA